MMEIKTLQKALAVMNYDGKSGTVYVCDDEIHIHPMTDKFSLEQVSDLEKLGFKPLPHDDGAFFCST